MADDGTIAYTVQSGDTLFSIAQNLLGDGYLWGQIVKLNPGIDQNNLVIGSSLKIPAKSWFDLSGFGGAAGNCIIQSGDTLLALRRKF